MSSHHKLDVKQSFLQLLTRTYSAQAQPLTYGHVYHVAICMWTRTCSLEDSEIAWDILSVGVGEQGPVIGSGPEYNVVVRQFLEESIVQENRQNAVAARMTYLLNNRYVLDLSLASYLSLFHMIITVSPAIVRSLPPTSLKQLRRSCSIAFQRQICSRHPLGVLAYTYEVLKTSLYVMS